MNYDPRDYNRQYDGNSQMYMEDDRDYLDEDSSNRYPGLGRGAGQRERADRARNPGSGNRDHYRDSSRESQRNRDRGERRPNRSTSRDRGRGYGAARAKQHDYGKARRT